MKTTEPALTDQNCCAPFQASGECSGGSGHRTLAEAKAGNMAQPETRDLAGGWFTMGANDGPYPQDGEGPARQVFVGPFSISPTAVTNAKFSEFVSATSYRTVAEEQGSSFVFHSVVAPSAIDIKNVAQTPWWSIVEAANWHRPEGGNSSIAHRMDHPVVHVTMRDALAFCAWSDCRLPTEAEWEFAARGCLDSKAYPWGDYLEKDGYLMANIWEGRFPDESTKPNGAAGTVGVKSNYPNSFGLHHMIGNVWEWTADRFTALHSPRPAKNPKGPLNGKQFAAKGGSYLCHQSYCMRYRTSSRQALDPMTHTGNVGFRIARDS